VIKTILGYDIQPGVTEQEYERWLFDVHAPDILANPYVDKLVFNKVLRPVQRTSDGSVETDRGLSFYRIAEMHFADEAAYQRYLDWFAEHPIPTERSPAGRTDFKFYLVTDVTEVDRGSGSDGTANQKAGPRADTPAAGLADDERDRLVAAVDTYLRLCEERKLDEAKEYLAPGAVLTFPGARRFTALPDMVADAQRQYRWVRKHRDHYDTFRNTDGDPVVVSRGTLDGENPDGAQFSGVRYQDRFVFRDDKIVDQQVWNDLAASGVLAASPRVPS
jgi:hypothetical protein